jgi:hypothetical protein
VAAGPGRAMEERCDHLLRAVWAARAMIPRAMMMWSRTVSTGMTYCPPISRGETPAWIAAPMPLSSAQNDESYGGLVSHTHEGGRSVLVAPCMVGEAAAVPPAPRAAGPFLVSGSPPPPTDAAGESPGHGPRGHGLDPGHASDVISRSPSVLDRAPAFPSVPSPIASSAPTPSASSVRFRARQAGKRMPARRR